jgi:hypothetical protein
MDKKTKKEQELADLRAESALRKVELALLRAEEESPRDEIRIGVLKRDLELEKSAYELHMGERERERRQPAT